MKSEIEEPATKRTKAFTFFLMNHFFMLWIDQKRKFHFNTHKLLLKTPSIIVPLPGHIRYALNNIINAYSNTL